jgi:hypothetical protein
MAGSWSCQGENSGEDAQMHFNKVRFI